MRSIDLLEEFTSNYSVSGHENNMINALKKNLQANVDDIYMDNLGSLITNIKGANKNIAIVAHMDEVGFFLKNIDDNGFCSFVNIGGINVDTIISQSVVLVNRDKKEFQGIVLSIPPHLMNDDKIELSSLVIDFGFENKKDFEKANIRPGDPIYFKSDFYVNNNKIMAKALDNRVGCAIVCELSDYFSKNKTTNNLYLCATTQEEVGLRGAQTILNKIKCTIDYVVVIDVSPIIDNIDKDGCKLGQGCLLRVQDPRTILDYEELLVFRDLAVHNNIKYQEYFSKGGTDASNLQVSGLGHKTSAICVGGRNIHSNRAVIDINDYKSALELIIKYIESKE